ncbi:MAG TPA: IS91 family transposase [Gemmataceae bacterium]|nr:IS91 family transposase [Gemmataceae bacterium]
MPTLLKATTNNTRPALEVGDIFRAYGDAYCAAHALPLQHQRVMRAIQVCRTASLGGHIEQCDRCGHRRPVYNSCRNRNCPKCQALAKARWLADRQAELLPVGYFHNVFTLPHELNDLLAANQQVLYTLLFRSVAETLQEFAADPQHGLGGQLGFTAVLHTWDQKLLYHVHLHCVIAGGALAGNGSRWLPARRNYLFPVRALSRVFRGKFLDGLRQVFAREQLVFPGRCAALAAPAEFQQWLERLRQKEWVVYSQPPFAGPEKVLDYLSRYTHRIAISNHRLRSLEGGQVTFDYRDRRDGNQVKQLTIPAAEFIRRFLTHVVPPSFCRIRHYGFLGNRVKQARLERCRTLLGANAAVKEVPKDPLALLLQLTGIDIGKCPECKEGTMVVVERLPGPQRGRVASSKPLDSS